MAIPLRPVDTIARARTMPRVPAWLAREALPLAVLAVYALAVVRLLPYELLQDGWLTLVGGREVATNGLTSTNELTEWSRGAKWVNQQWLAHLAAYGTVVAGGVKAALLAHVALLVATLAGAFAAGRSLGGRAPAVAVVGAVAMFMAPWSLQLRAQTLALPLFVAVLWLLAADSRRPSRRVFLVLPLLVLWANVHGTVVLGVALAVLRGLTRRSLVLVAVPPACVLASPYALDLVGYYRTMLFDSTLRSFVVEWARTQPSVITALFYFGAAATAILLVRNGRRLTWFERGALVLTLVGGIMAVRSIVWFAVTAIVLVPLLLDRGEERRDSAPKVGLAIGAASMVALAFAVGAAATRSESWLTQSWPEAAAERTAALAAADEDVRVFSDDRFADWLLWTRPELRGKIAYDIRFELLTRAHLERIVDYNSAPAGSWRKAIDGYDVVVVDARARRKVDALLASGFDTEYRDERVAVLSRR